jgi:hypothetical protein
MEREFGKEWKQRIGEVGRPAIVRAGSTPKLSRPGPGQIVSSFRASWRCLQPLLKPLLHDGTRRH